MKNNVILVNNGDYVYILRSQVSKSHDTYVANGNGNYLQSTYKDVKTLKVLHVHLYMGMFLGLWWQVITILLCNRYSVGSKEPTD